MQDTKLTNVVRAYFGAYESENREAVETLLADGSVERLFKRYGLKFRAEDSR